MLDSLCPSAGDWGRGAGWAVTLGTGTAAATELRLQQGAVPRRDRPLWGRRPFTLGAVARQPQQQDSASPPARGSAVQEGGPPAKSRSGASVELYGMTRTLVFFSNLAEP